MKIDATSPPLLSPLNQTSAPEKSAAPTFANMLRETVSHTNEHLLAADSALQHLALGDATSLHQTMLAMEQAKLSFQFLEQVRNRLMSAYQDILREQI